LHEATPRRPRPYHAAPRRTRTHEVALGRTGSHLDARGRSVPRRRRSTTGLDSTRPLSPVGSNRSRTGKPARFFVWTLPGCRSLTESVFRRNDDGMGDHSLTSLLCVPEAVHWRTFEAKRRLPTFQNFLDFEFQLQPLQSSLHEQLLPLFRF
jgi:hypothetical protein